MEKTWRHELDTDPDDPGGVYDAMKSMFEEVRGALNGQSADIPYSLLLNLRTKLLHQFCPAEYERMDMFLYSKMKKSRKLQASTVPGRARTGALEQKACEILREIYFDIMDA